MTTVDISTAPAADPHDLTAYPKRTAALWVLFLATFMDLLDNTIVNVALPSIQQDLGASYSAVQWVVAGYGLSFALLLITGGRLGDMFGRKRLFVVGVVGFAAASALCGAAQSPGMLIAARVLQGAAGAMMVPQVMSLIQVMFAPKERAAALGMYGGLAGLATVAGPIGGALLTEGDVAGLGWRAIFLINLPVAAVTAVLALRLVPESSSPGARLDLLGVLLVTLGLGLLLYPLVQGRDFGWPAWTFAAMAASVPVLGVFLWHQRRRAASGRTPLVVLSLFRHRSFAAGQLAGGGFFVAMAGWFLVLTLFLQEGLGFSVMHAGLTVLPWSVATPLLAALGGTVLVPRLGRAVMWIGMLTMAAGLASFALVAAHYGADLHSWQLIVPLFVGGAGMGMVLAPLFDFVLADVPAKDAGSASGVFSAVEQVGFGVGVALVGTLFFNLVDGRAASLATARAEVFAYAVERTLFAAVALLLVATCLVFLLPKRPSHHGTH